MTEKLYDLDGYVTRFAATVLSCEPTAGGYRIRLDRTAFCPEGGGQAGDRGILDNTRVLCTQIDGETIYHLCDRPLIPGTRVDGIVDFALRYDRMQNHTGEHIVSGLVHRHYGWNNVGFHLGETDTTLDFDGMLSREQLDIIEEEANAAIYADLPVTVTYPLPDALAAIPYRSKRDFDAAIRIVTIPGYDVCACCAPHVARTGEIGMIKLLDCVRYKGGVRIHMVCGFRALRDYRERYTAVSEIARSLSVPQTEAADGVSRLQAELDKTRAALAAARHDLTLLRVASLTENEAGHILCFLPAETDDISLRQTALLGAEKARGVCAAVAGDAGDYRLTVASCHIPLRERVADMRQALSLRGGGRDQLLSGRSTATEEEIRAFFAKL